MAKIMRSPPYIGSMELVYLITFFVGFFMLNIYIYTFIPYDTKKGISPIQSYDLEMGWMFRPSISPEKSGGVGGFLGKVSGCDYIYSYS